MSKAYSSNLTQWQWELIESLIPAALTRRSKPRGKDMVGAPMRSFMC